MGFKGWICTLVLAFAGLTAHAQVDQTVAADGCISQADMQDIARSFRQFNGLANREYCYDGSETSYLLSGIMFMRNTQFSSTMPKSSDELFSGRFASAWWTYFIGRIDEFQVESSCPKGVVAYVYMFGNTMYVCPSALTPAMSSLDLASVFMHEARHIDGFPHTTCRNGPRAGMQGACDTRISEGGSYAVTVETYAQIAKYATAVHPALRSYAKASSVVYADEAFDSPVRIDRVNTFVALTNDLKFHEFTVSGSNVTIKALGSAPALGHMVRRAQYLVFYPEDKNLTSGFLFLNDEGTIAQTAGDVSNEYNNSTPALRAEWVDMYLGGTWHAKVKRTEVIFGCEARSTTLTTLSTNGETPVAVIYPNGYDRVQRSNQVLMASGKVFDMGCNGNSAFLRESSTRFDQSFKRLYRSGGETIALGTNGKLYRVNGSTSTVLSTALDGRIHDFAAAESFNFFQ